MGAPRPNAVDPNMGVGFVRAINAPVGINLLFRLKSRQLASKMSLCKPTFRVGQYTLGHRTMSDPSQHWIETYKSLLSLSVEGFKYLALINGGAIVALLAYVANVSSKGVPVPDLHFALFGFASGLGFCGLTIISGYLTQLKLLNEIGRTNKGLIPHEAFLYSAITFYFLSLASFCTGTWYALRAF